MEAVEVLGSSLSPRRDSTTIVAARRNDSAGAQASCLWLENPCLGPPFTGRDGSLSSDLNYTALFSQELGNSFLEPTPLDVSNSGFENANINTSNWGVNSSYFLSLTNEFDHMDTYTLLTYDMGFHETDSSSSGPLLGSLSPESMALGPQREDVTPFATSSQMIANPSASVQNCQPASTKPPTPPSRAVQIERAAPLLRCTKCPELFARQEHFE